MKNYLKNNSSNYFWGVLVFTMLVPAILSIFWNIKIEISNKLVIDKHLSKNQQLEKDFSAYKNLIEKKSERLTAQEIKEYKLLIEKLSILNNKLVGKNLKSEAYAISRYQALIRRLIDMEMINAGDSRALAERQRLIAKAQQESWEREVKEAKKIKEIKKRFPATKR